MNISELDTPQVLINLDALEQNLKYTAELARKAGVKLRPHFKTHKNIWIAKKQLDYGACGMTAAKLGEAEILAYAGIKDILIAFPLVGKAKLNRLGQLLERGNKITVSVDHETVAEGLSELGKSQGMPIPLYIDVNTGLDRCGPEPGQETAALAKRISRLDGVEIRGLMTHGGHSYGKITTDELRQIAAEEAGGLVESKRLIEEAGIAIKEISVGSTPTSKFIEEQQGVTEMRPGAYVYGDGVQLSTGVIREGELAMNILTTVVSTPRKGTVIVDAGSKCLSSDLNPHRKGYGFLKNQPDVYIERLSEEHGIVNVPEDSTISIGDQLEFIPNHCCVVSNLHEELLGIRGDEVVQTLHVDGRGKVR